MPEPLPADIVMDESDDDLELMLEDNVDAEGDELQLEDNDDDEEDELTLEANDDDGSGGEDDLLALEANDDAAPSAQAPPAAAARAAPAPAATAPAAAPAPAFSAASVPLYAAGQFVRVHGLQSKPELNGRVGCVTIGDQPHDKRPKDASAARVGVLVCRVAEPIALKVANLRLIPRAEYLAAVPWWRAAPHEQHAANQALAAALADASLDYYAAPTGVIMPGEVHTLQAAAQRKLDNVLRAHADPEGRRVATDMGLLDAADCALPPGRHEVRERLWRKFFYKELGGALFRAGLADEGHKCCCAAARSCDTFRELYAHWVSRLLDSGRRPLADAVAAHAAKMGAFTFATQRPVSGFLRGLAVLGHPGPWYDPNTIPAARAILDACPSILKEYEALRRGGGFETYPSPAIARGDWSDFMLIHGGRQDARHCSRCPRLSALLCGVGGPLRLDAASMVVGSAFFSRMRPGTHLKAHCGPNNLRLRVHLGVDVPGDGEWKIRVGDEVREWRQGEVLVFDDSFEHEVWHEPGAVAGPGKGPKAVATQAATAAEHAEAGAKAALPSRVVLIVDIWHPAIPPHERRGQLGDGPEAARYDSITQTDAPLEAMTERELSDGSVRRVVAQMNGH